MARPVKFCWASRTSPVLGKSKRLGLIGMKERVAIAGGTLTIESSPGVGTTVRVEIPFKPTDEPALPAKDKTK